jgi:hypothetical protein
MPLLSRPTLFVTTILLAGFLEPTVADWRSDAGWTAYKDFLGPGYPDGTNVLIIQAEGDGSDDDGYQYSPDSGDREMSGKDICDPPPDESTTVCEPPAAGSTSNHALTVAKRFYGNNTSMAPGVTDIYVYSASDYINKLANDKLPTDRKVHCNAWIGPHANEGFLSNVDRYINVNGYLVVGGLNNGSDTSVPDLLGATYNALSVGLTSGNHSRDGTPLVSAVYVTGRVKPEIVLNDTLTSWATGDASSIAAVLYQVAVDGGHSDAEDHSEVMKAIMMAGATKHEFNSWDRTLTRPLDEIFGAGEAHILNSYHILHAGEQNPGPVAATGWSYNTISDPSGPSTFLERSYEFSVPAHTWAEDFSVVLNWHYSGSGTLRNLKLELFSLSDGTTLLDESNSPKDNVEHIYRRHLAPGDYRLTVSRSDGDNDSISFGLAWQSQFGEGSKTLVAESGSSSPEVTVTKIFKNQSYVIERSLDLTTWTPVHLFTPTTWADYLWEDPDAYTPGTEVFYRSGWSAP